MAIIQEIYKCFCSLLCRSI